MLRSPTHAVIGASDPEVMGRFLAAFGFTEERRAQLPPDAARLLYGLDSELCEIDIRAPAATRGWLRVVETPHPQGKARPYGHGPFLIDLYTRDIDKSMSIAASLGAHLGPVVSYPVAGLGSVSEGRVIGPDGLALGFVMTEDRRPSLLDTQSEALHSELHAYVCVVSSVTAAAPFWRDKARLEQLLDSTVDDPGISTFMELPRAGVSIRIAHLTDPAVNPVRFELMEFPDDRGFANEPVPLRPGLHTAAFAVPDLTTAQAGLAGAEWRSVVDLDTPLHPRARAVAGVAPGGVAFELWQEGNR